MSADTSTFFAAIAEAKYGRYCVIVNDTNKNERMWMRKEALIALRNRN